MLSSRTRSSNSLDDGGCGRAAFVDVVPPVATATPKITGAAEQVARDVLSLARRLSKFREPASSVCDGRRGRSTRNVSVTSLDLRYLPDNAGLADPHRLLKLSFILIIHDLR